MEEFGVSRTALGVVGSSSLWGYMFTTILAGILSDRFRRKYAVSFGIFGFSFLTALCGLTRKVKTIPTHPRKKRLLSLFSSWPAALKYNRDRKHLRFSDYSMFFLSGHTFRQMLFSERKMNKHIFTLTMVQIPIGGL
jgi:MFS family permease